MTDIQILLRSPEEDSLLEILLALIIPAVSDGDVIIVSHESHFWRVKKFLASLSQERDVCVKLQNFSLPAFSDN
jgi:hypothetical protein